jgi:hypothetical protein
MNMVGAFGGAAGMAFAGRLFHQGRADLVFIVFAGMYALSAVCWLAVDVTRPLETKERSSLPVPVTPSRVAADAVEV